MARNVRRCIARCERYRLRASAAWSTGGSVVVATTAAIVYALAVAPPDRVSGSVTVE